MAAVLAMVLFYRPVKWWEADRSSAGLAPLPQEEKAAVVQVYAARTINWKGGCRFTAGLQPRKRMLIITRLIR